MKHMNKSRRHTADINVIIKNQWKKHYKQLWYDYNYDVEQYVGNANRAVDITEFHNL